MKDSLSSSNSYHFQNQGEFELKGLGEKSLFSVTIKSQLEPSFSEDISCPNGHGLLTFDMNDSGIYVYSCKICGFEKG